MSVISVGDVLKLCEIARRCYRNCRDCTGEYKRLTTEARSLSNLLEDITDKFDKIPDNKRQQLQDAYEPCIEVLQELDTLLTHYNGLDTKTKRTWDRITYDPEKSRILRERITSSVTILNSFYTSLIHDNQVLILEALERLEHDYRGGHREESIASLERITSGAATDEDEEDEAAWTQVLRDLEDVGVAKQDALSYRDVIIDWLVQAVNEGRLLEQRAEPDAFQTLSVDFGEALSVLDFGDIPGTHHLDVPNLWPSQPRSQSTPVRPPSPLMTPPTEDYQRTRSIPSPSTTSVSVPERSAVSSYAVSHSPDTDTSSLYAWPESVSKVASTHSSVEHQIKRVPVPSLGLPQVTPTAPSPVITATSSSSPASSLAAFTVPAPPARAPPSIPQVDATPPILAADTMPPIPATPTAPEVLSSLEPPLAFPEALLQTSARPVQPHVEPLVLPVPPSYYDKHSTETADLYWTAQQAIAAWSRRDFVTASRHLEEQLAAVERGHTVISTGTQPDRRILRHLIGVCHSFAGNFVKAKQSFESVFNGIYLNRTNLDDGDIAAARWLGDVCLHLREHCNAALAWGVALEGSAGRYGAVRDRTRRICDELRLLDHWLFVFRRIENSFQSNMDPTDIFRQTHAVEKSNLIATLKIHLYEAGGFPGPRPSPPVNPAFSPSFMISARPKVETSISEGFLLSPLISLGAWPLPWDPTFNAVHAVQLDRHMNTIRTVSYIKPLVERNLQSLTLGDSKKLHYVTKRGSRWLIDTVKQGLQEMCIEHAESPNTEAIYCTLNQHRDGYAFSEGVEISFRKLQFRSIYGLRISDVKWSTRSFGPGQEKDTSDFRDILKSILERAENEAASASQYTANTSTALSQNGFQTYG
ncbi:hypothetical protein HBI65_210360 [Parastagonospora nodorum]|nr:hypothetical protein HBH42_167870 [Parastagonospora nodorum]KAH5429431.1 hypothetical protein HBI32_070830 [Parastagonospora nodorum]KAH5489154.1 hypothetical protein HBI31_134750 [Parastagonospora nodorum]KAH6082023.1 hypothetical protein HBI65_210360 [Parastagonospora nodorum]KAH6440468.1 hypothetical protein HBI59_129690 [Parastagonospora nodorum]